MARLQEQKAYYNKCFVSSKHRNTVVTANNKQLSCTRVWGNMELSAVLNSFALVIDPNNQYAMNPKYWPCGAKELSGSSKYKWLNTETNNTFNVQSTANEIFHKFITASFMQTFFLFAFIFRENMSLPFSVKTSIQYL